MYNQEEINKTISLEGDKAVITRTVKETMSIDQLKARKNDLQFQKQDLIRQSQDIKSRFDRIASEENEFDKLIAEYEQSQKPPTTPEPELPEEPIVIEGEQK